MSEKVSKEYWVLSCIMWQKSQGKRIAGTHDVWPGLLSHPLHVLEVLIALLGSKIMRDGTHQKV